MYDEKHVMQGGIALTFQPVWSGGSGDLDDLIFEGEEPRESER